MNSFENNMFNPNYFNESYYRQNQNYTYMFGQDERVLKAVHAFSEMLDQVAVMDDKHQQETLLMCLMEMARRSGWR